MIEVFKTNVEMQHQADMLKTKIQEVFRTYTVNFDLADCDKILRVKSLSGSIQSANLIDLLRSFGFHAEVLPDNLSVEIMDLIGS